MAGGTARRVARRAVLSAVVASRRRSVIVARKRGSTRVPVGSILGRVPDARASTGYRVRPPSALDRLAAPPIGLSSSRASVHRLSRPSQRPSPSPLACLPAVRAVRAAAAAAASSSSAAAAAAAAAVAALSCRRRRRRPFLRPTRRGGRSPFLCCGRLGSVPRPQHTGHAASA
ncbi:hypothetical protein CXG81DRAFT_19025 [Caulochytrium protostelioides]|uniref:Uncharacterized protein n=1 Tax=Caulochytrium protostelioides TaxID=1555241 RepID=A0A4V1IUN3_9FUNG|nr:hypothetical protein CXG81DRAFT_19025 [Caulochytrium protostelioides]|eukprot:RKP01159.1 hypothetical protein CXG81DRAFT_19025 [Caulochytrium protostelioides]